MKLRVLPPVGEKVSWLKPGTPVRAFAGGDEVVFTNSGTSALALVLAALAERGRRAGRAARQVLVPAYGCPDILSAVVHAGLEVKLVDLARDSPFPSAAGWAGAIGDDTLALISVGMLGLRDPVTPAQAIAAGLDPAAFIEDCCQIHPMAVAAVADRNLVLSFGRGKPVSMMHGGAARLVANLVPMCPTPERRGGRVEFARIATAAAAYNVLRSPRLYGWVTSMPGLGIGTTRYAPLHAVGAMNIHARNRLDLQSGWADPRRQELQNTIRDLLASLRPRVLAVDIWQRFGSGGEWLLRYPLLLKNRQVRDKALSILNRRGLGASGMYMESLPRLPGVESVWQGGRFDHAQSFADRLLTLPLHEDVLEADAIGMCRALAELEEA